MNSLSLIGLILESVWMPPLEQVNPDWSKYAPSTTFVNLISSTGIAVTVVPCEVEVPGAFPNLGVQLEEARLVSEYPRRWLSWHEDSLVQHAEIQQYLPAEVEQVDAWDSLGEGAISAIKIITANGLAVVLRHQYPPMTLGVEIVSQNEI